MALLTKKEFAEKCGTVTKKLSVYISRGKVILNGDQLIDDQNPINIQFYEHSLKLADKKPMESNPKSNGRVIKIKEPKAKVVDKKKLEKYDKRFDLDTAKREMEIEKLKQELEIARMKSSKQLGKLIPTEMVKAMVAKYFKNVTIEYKQSVDIIVTIFAKKTKMNVNDKAEMKAQMVRTINDAVENSVQLTKKELNQIVAEYSEVR